MPLDANVAGFLNVLAAADLPPISQGTPELARDGLRKLLVEFVDPATLPVVGSVQDAIVAGGIPVRVYRPVAGDGPLPTCVFLHGGGFVIGDLDTHERMCRGLCADVGAVVVSVDYRLAPEHPFPAAVEDAYAALRWVAEHVEDYGADAGRLVVAGDSAGGNLSAVCAQLAHADGLALAAQLLVYPVTDMGGDFPSHVENAEGYFLTHDDMEWFGAQYLGGPETDPAVAARLADPRVSPLRAESLAGLAPAVVATAEFDPLRDDGNAYAAALEAAGVRVEHQQFDGLIHGFYGMELLSPTIAAATAWIHGRLKQLVG